MVIDSVMWPNIYLNWHQSQYESGGPQSKTFRCYYLSSPLLLQSCQQAYEFPATTLSKWLLGGQQNLNLPLNAVTQIEEALWAQQRSQPVRNGKAQGQHVTTSPTANSNSEHEKISRETDGGFLFPAAGMPDLKYKIQIQESCPKQSLLPTTPSFLPATGFFHSLRPGGLEKIWVHKWYWSS